MIAFSAFYDLILPELRGCTTAMVDLHLLHTARDFCERTSSWRTTWSRGSVAGRATYDISEPEDKSEIVRVTRLAIADELLWDDNFAEHRQGADEEAPKYDRAEPPFTLNDLNTEITLIADEVPTATTAGAIELAAALKPAFTADRLPDHLKTQHAEAMRLGTLTRLMQMGNKPWTDRPLAGEYRSEYARLLNLAAANAQMGNTKQRLRTRKWG